MLFPERAAMWITRHSLNTSAHSLTDEMDKAIKIIERNRQSDPANAFNAMKAVATVGVYISNGSLHSPNGKLALDQMRSSVSALK